MRLLLRVLMAFSYIASAVVGAGTTGSIDTTGANLIVACTSGSGGIGTVSDSKSNTYTSIQFLNDGNLYIRLLYCAGPTVGSGHTFTVASNFPALAVAAYSGAHATPLDQSNGNATTSTTPGSITPGEDNELLVCLGAAGGTTDPSACTGFTVRQHIPGDNATYVGIALADLIQTSLAAANPDWNTSGASRYGAAIASFKVAGGGGATRPVKMAGWWGGYAGTGGGFAG